MISHINKISQLLSENDFSAVDYIKELPSSGSNRIYFRIYFLDKNKQSILASFNPDINENIAHYSFTLHFKNKGFNVPEIYAKDSTYKYFLLQDLGDLSLFDDIKNLNNENLIAIYKIVLNKLLKFQIEGIDGLDLDVAYPVKEFSFNNILWDLNYFKYYFVKTHNLIFNELQLEKDFKTFADFLLTAKNDFFLYRDFQSRNIMIHKNKPWFIDFQGGRKGPLAYDVVSLLFQAKANLNNEIKEELFDYYLNELSKISEGLASNLKENYDAFIYFRTMQVMGAYGFRGKVERKGHFLQSIPFAIISLKELLKNKKLNIHIPELLNVLQQISEITEYNELNIKSDKLLIDVSSFSYKKGGIPTDISGNGGGFVFDCRFLPNPYRHKELKEFTGQQKPIIDFFKEKKEMDIFLANSFNLVKDSIENYLERNFDNLQINFGCTGGKHRSVYSAEWMAKKLQHYFKDKINLTLKHHQIEKGI